MADDIDYCVTGGRAEITLNRPEVMNAYTENTLIELNHAIEDALDDETVYVILLTGNGDGFCTGRDLRAGTKSDYRLSEGERLGRVASVMRHLYAGPKPSVAALNGPAVGGGMEIALACDFRVMSENAFFRDGHVDTGFTPATGGAWLLPRLIGEARAKQTVLLGDDIGPDTAVDWGLALDSVSQTDLLERARTVANRLRDKPASALRESKALVDPTITSFEEHAQATLDARWACQDTPESREARAALREDRDPEFNRD
ncbi:enoyl-CoA hydratase/isomerase family protein [Natronorubrum sp. FCH18a]|uniref:enoyl-CoA hydratase/isomerase family protein n=1 Tax=Natronorubrum sp. FCH18a TaxID=3447018 RepID=UPI003F51A7FE